MNAYIAYTCAECGFSPSLAGRIIRFVSGNPGATTRAVRAAVTGRAEDVGAMIAALIEDGRLEDRGGRSRKLYTRRRRAGPPPTLPDGPAKPSPTRGASPPPSTDTASTGVGTDAR